jgi:antitoxin component HigA of HigAB toxin-antitoxin module
MKIVEALKKIPDLQRKAEDIRVALARYCADLDNEKPEYETQEKQRAQISIWLQSHSDILKEIEILRTRIQKTNLETDVDIEVSEGKTVTKSIARWIHRRKDLSKLESEAWRCLTSRGLKPQGYQKEGEDGVKIANVRKYYDQRQRDKMLADLLSEKSLIDGRLEVINAVTDLLDL